MIRHNSDCRCPECIESMVEELESLRLRLRIATQIIGRFMLSSEIPDEVKAEIIASSASQ